jgi:hypothetical protein
MQLNWRARWARGILALGALALGLLTARSLPAQALALPFNDASCSNAYHYQLVAHGAAPQAIHLWADSAATKSGSPAAGYLYATLWSKFYLNTHAQVVACHQYHVAVRLCAASGVTLPLGIMSAYIEDVHTGVVGYGWNSIEFTALQGGHCITVTSLDSLYTDVAATDAVRGLGYYTAASPIVFTQSYSPIAAHPLLHPR